MSWMAALRTVLQTTQWALAAWLLLVATLFASMWANPVSFYATYDTTAALRMGAAPTEFLGDVAWFVRPSAPGRHMVVMVHGRSGNVAQVVPLARALVASGHGVLLFDMPRAGLPPLSAPTHPRLWGAMIDDARAIRAIEAAVAHARTLTADERSPIALYGHSLGGTYALQAAAIACVDVVISDGSPFSLAAAALSHFVPSKPIVFLPPALFAPARGSAFGWLFEFVDREVWAFTLPTATACATPPRWLGLHSSDDRVVPVEHLEQLRARTAGAWRSLQTLDVGGRHWEPDRPERAVAVLAALAQ